MKVLIYLLLAAPIVILLGLIIYMSYHLYKLLKGE